MPVFPRGTGVRVHRQAGDIRGGGRSYGLRPMQAHGDSDAREYRLPMVPGGLYGIDARARGRPFQ